MTDKRNIVIKVKYPISGKAAGNLAPRMITEWHVKRIVFAACALVLILVSLVYIIKKVTQKVESDNISMVVNAIENPITPQVDIKEAGIKKMTIPVQEIAKTNSSVKSIKEPNKKNIPTIAARVNETIKKQTNKEVADVTKEREHPVVNHNVLRAALTYGIKNKEPIGEIVRTVDANRKKPVWVYYFTELKTMNGSKVYHEWLKNGVVVSRQELVISGNVWRTSSRKLLAGSAKGNWIVRLVDKGGRLLNEKSFKVE